MMLPQKSEPSNKIMFEQPPTHDGCDCIICKPKPYREAWRL